MEERELSIEIPLVGSITSDSGSHFVDAATICLIIIAVIIFKKIIGRK